MATWQSGWNLHLAPLEDRERTGGQWQERRLLTLAEDLAHRDATVRMAPARGDVGAPDQGGLDHRLEASELATTEEAVAHVRHRPLDPRLVFRVMGARGVDERAVVLGQLAIRAAELGVVQVGLEDSGLQVVADPQARAPAEEAQGLEVAGDPGLLVHAQHRADEVHPGGAQRRDEGPHGAAAPADGISPETEPAEVELHRLAEGGLGQQHRRARGIAVADAGAYVSLEGAQAEVDLTGVVQALPDRGRRRLLE